MAQSFFDHGKYKWRKVTGEPGLSYKVHNDYSILGYTNESLVADWKENT